jgi:endonuclease III
MKNSKDYSKKIQKLHGSLSRKYPKAQKVTHDDPTDAIVYGIICSRLDEKVTETAIKKFSDYFIDLNDLRVSRIEEIVEMLGEDTPVTRDVASTITTVLRAIFNEYHKVSLEGLKKAGKRPAKQILEKLEGTNRFVVDYCMLTSLQGHAVPLTDGMIEYLKDKGFVYPDATEHEIGGFLAKQISAKKGYEFYAVLRHESEAYSSEKKKKKAKTASTKKKTAKITKEKTKTKKKATKTKKRKK